VAEHCVSETPLHREQRNATQRNNAHAPSAPGVRLTAVSGGLARPLGPPATPLPPVGVSFHPGLGEASLLGVAPAVPGRALRDAYTAAACCTLLHAVPGRAPLLALPGVLS
jgi:hypothetical protein